jgi:hypothetical protein
MSWLQPRKIRKPAADRVQRFRPRLEQLEDRLAPAVFVVTTTADSAAAGSGSLRAALSAANNGDTVLLPAGIYRDTLSPAFAVGTSITIEAVPGASLGQVVVDGNGIDRVFNVTGSPTVTFQGVVIQNGKTSGSGGGIEARGGGTTNLVNSIITGNDAAGNGGGVCATGTGASINITHSQVTNNQSGIFAGGVALSFGVGAALTVTDSTVSGNTTDSASGGIGIINSGSAQLTVIDSTISGNTILNASATFGGGGIFVNSSSDVNITNTTISGNVTTNGDGGGIADALQNNNLNITGSTISNNRAGGANGNGGGISYTIGKRVTLNSSVVSVNSAAQGGGGLSVNNAAAAARLTGDLFSDNQTGNSNGGGIEFTTGVSINISSSTFAGNIAGNIGGAMNLQNTGSGATASNVVSTTIAGNRAGINGGAVEPEGTGDVNFINDTIVNNFAGGTGGGIREGGGGKTFLLHTIVALNNDVGGSPDLSGGTVVTDGGNLIGNNTGAPAVFGAGAPNGHGDFVGTGAAPLNPRLVGLANNGGPLAGAPGSQVTLPTLLPLHGSLAIDNGKTAVSGLNAPAADERGVVRPDAGRTENPNIGAVETQVPEDFTFVLNADGSLSEVAAGGSPTVLSPAGTIHAIASVTDDFGFNDVFAITSNGQLWEHSDQIAGGWEMLSAGSFLSMTTAVNSAGAAIVAAVPTDHSLWECTSLVLNGWELLSPAGTILSASAATDSSAGFPQEVIYAITVGGPNNLWSHNASGWTLLSTGSFQQISAGQNSAGQTILFGVLTDDSLWEFNPAFNIGLNLLNLSPAGTILSASAGAADQVFAITSDHHLWTHTLAGWDLLSLGTFETISGSATPAAGVGEAFGVLSDGSLWEYNPAFGGTDFMEILTSGVAGASAPQKRF